MIVNVGKTPIICPLHRTVSTNFNYKLCNNLILRIQCVNVLGVLLDCNITTVIAHFLKA
jgi:hypothetical protein